MQCAKQGDERLAALRHAHAQSSAQSNALHASELASERATAAQLRDDIAAAIEKECALAEALAAQTVRAERAESGMCFS